MMYPPGKQNMPLTQMQMMGAGTEIGLAGLYAGGTLNSNSFIFVGNSIQLESRLNGTSDQDYLRIVDSNITVSGTALKSVNLWSLFCTLIWGSLIIIPLICLCMDWWKKCTYAAFSIASNAYMSLGKLINAPNMRNITLTVHDNTFDAEKATILYNSIVRSQIKGFTFINIAGQYDYNGTEYSDFVKNMQPIKQLKNISTDLRWGNQIVF